MVDNVENMKDRGARVMAGFKAELNRNNRLLEKVKIALNDFTKANNRMEESLNEMEQASKPK